MKGVGAEHHMLTSAACRCECEHSHLHAFLFSARPCRATPFKREKDHPALTYIRFVLLKQEIIEEIFMKKWTLSVFLLDFCSKSI